MENSKVVIDPEASWDGINLEIDFQSPIDGEKQKEIKKVVSAWAQKGITEGYGEGYMHYEGKSTCGKSGMWLLFWLDMGSADEVAFWELEKCLLPYAVDKIKVGFEAPQEYYEQDEEFKQAFKEFQELKKVSKNN